MSQPAPPAAGELGPDDLIDVLTELLDVSSNWENIGLGLRLSPGILQALKGPYKPPEDCLRDMLREWLNRSPDPSWQSLIRALRSPVVGKDTLASHLEAKYCSQEGCVRAPSPLIGTTNPPFRMSRSEHLAHHSQLTPNGPVHHPGSQRGFPRPSLQSNPVSQQSSRKPPPRHRSSASLPRGRGITAPRSSLPAPPHSRGLSPLPQQMSSYRDSRATSKQGDRASKGESHVLPSYSHSPLPEPQQVRSSSRPDTLQQSPFHGKPPSIQTLLPTIPQYSLCTLLTPGQFTGNLPEPNVVHLPPFRMSRSEHLAHHPQLPPHGPVHHPGSHRGFPRPSLRSNPVFQQSERKPPPGHHSPLSLPPVGPEVRPVPIRLEQRYPYHSQHSSQVSGPRYGRRFGASQGFGYCNFPGSPGYPYPQNQYSSSSGRVSNLPLSTHSHNLHLNQVQQVPGFMQSFRHANLDQLDPFADYLRETYEDQIPGFFAIQWPPPPTRKAFNLSLIHSETIRCTAPNDELVRLLMTGCVPEYVRRNTSGHK